MKHYSRGFVLTKGVLLAGLCAGLFTPCVLVNELMIVRDGLAGDPRAWSPNFENSFHSLERPGEIILE